MLLITAAGLLWRGRFPVALALGGATPAGAALVFGDTAIPTFYAVALGAPVLLAADLMGRTRERERLERPVAPGVGLLLLLGVWGVFITFVAPMLFNGTPVLGQGGQNNALAAGVLTSSNLAQLVYLVLSISVVMLMSRTPTARPYVIGTALAVSMAISLWAYLNRELGLPYLEKFFDNSPTFTYIAAAPGGVVRFRGIFSEPAALAVSCLVAVSFFVSLMAVSKGWRRYGCLVIAGVSGYLGVMSTSTTFFVAAAILLVVVIAIRFRRLISHPGRLTVSRLLWVAVGLVLVPLALPLVLNFLNGQVSDKVGTSSYKDRSGADSDSYELIFRTLGLGAGLGSNRPSSFLASLLGTVGVVGTLLFFAVVILLIFKVWPQRSVRPVCWALIAIIVSKLISGPDLNDTSGLLWLALGIMARSAAAAAAPNVRRRSVVSVDEIGLRSSSRSTLQE